MKSKKATYSVVSFFFLFVVSLVLSSCESSRVGPDVGRPNPPAPTAVPLVLKGVVLDFATGGPIAGATVLVQGSSLSTTADGNGVFTFSDLSSISASSVVLIATASTYGYGNSVATISKSNNETSSPIILLKKIVVGTPAAVTTASGGTGHTTSGEAAPNTSNIVKIVVLPGSPSQFQISISALSVDQTPSSADPTTTNDISDVIITTIPENATFSGVVTFVLPYYINPGTTLPINTVVNNAWQPANINATVDPTGYAATTTVSKVGIFAIFDLVGIISTTSSSSIVQGTELTASSSGGLASISLPNSLIYTPTLTPPAFVYSDLWRIDLLSKILHMSFSSTPGTLNNVVTLNLNFPTLPSNWIVNNVEFNPDKPNESGTWYYRWYWIKEASTSTITLKKTPIFTMTYATTNKVYFSEDGTIGTTLKNGWYWVAHNQGGIGSYYGL